MSADTRNSRDPRLPKRRLRVALIAVLAAAVVLAGAILAVAFHPWTANGGTGPSAFAPVSITRTTPGSPGCRAVAGDICYLSEVSSAFSNLAASNLFFAVSNVFPTSYPQQSSISLEVGASVSLLNGSSVAGVWNYTIGAWSQAPTGVLPTTAPIQVVLDTGLASDSTFVGAYFYIEHSSPYGGSVGFPLN